MPKNPSLTRRQLLQNAALAGVGLSLPARLALASATSAQKFIFVFAYGGWDPTRVFATEFRNRSVDMERDSGEETRGDLSFVAHDNRPSVTRFFDRHASQSLIVNGVLVPSVAHVNCMRLMMTGTSSDGAPDWPAILGAEVAADYSLPHLVVGGPSYPGDLGYAVTRTGSSGQLEGLLNGEILELSDTPVSMVSRRSEDLMDDYISRRAAAAAQGASEGRELALSLAYQDSLERTLELKGLSGIVDWSSGSTLSTQADLAVDVLARGLSRCVTLNADYGWDSHSDNDSIQSTNFESLFSALVDLATRLELTPGTQADSLMEETVVVVLSEMGRTASLNDANGKDHWPFTSWLLFGPGIAGGRSVGGFDEFYYGLQVDPDTAEASDSGVDLTHSTMGSTLLQLAGIDHERFLPGTITIPGLLA